MKIMMVCLGNICRSPMAEGILRHMVGVHKLPWIVHSGGTGASYHEGAPPHRHSVATCAQNGIDISHQRARVFTPADLRYYDLIYAMSDDIYDTLIDMAGQNDTLKGKIKLILNEVNEGLNESVPDPYYGTAAAYPPVYNMIYQACEKIVERYVVKEATGNK